MSYPDPPSLSTSYTAKEQALGDGSFPGQELDTDLMELRDAYIALLNFVKGITRSDGKLANASVMPETLGPGITLNFEPPTAWATAVNYTVGQTVFETDAFYICVAVHTSSVFANDLASGRWDLLVDFADVASDAANSAAAAAASEATAILKAAEAATSASAAAASATTATTKASEASTSASAAAASATTATTKASEASTDAGTASAAATTATTKASEASTSASAAAASAASIRPTQVVAVNGSDTVLLSHNNAVLFCTTTLTLSLTAAAALGNGFKLTVIADGGDVTIDPNGSETIDLAPSLLLRRGEIVSFVGDGTEFWSLSRLGNPDQLFDVTSPVASLAFDVPPGVKTARITYDNFEPVNNDDALGLQIGVNGSGGAFLTTSSYFNHYVNLVVATVNGSQITTTHFGISTQIDNALPTPHGYGYGEVVIQGLNQASEVVKIFGSRGGFNSSAQQIGGMFNGRITSTEDNFNAIRLIGSTGNINKLRGRIEWGY